MYHDDRDVRVYISGDGGARGGGRAAPYAREAGGGGGSRVTGNRVFITNLSYNTTWQARRGSGGGTPARRRAPPFFDPLTPPLRRT